MPSKNHKLVVVESPTKARTLTKILPGWQICASYGHIRDLPKSELGIDVNNNFQPRYIIPRDKRKTVNAFKKILADARWIYLATDPDREGEAIAWHIQELLKDDTSVKGREIKRVSFHEITSEAILEAFKNPRLVDVALVDAQQARRVLDRLVGYSLSPLLWQKIRKGLSAGRVQSVTVRLIVEREAEIRQFKPREYWNLKAIFQTPDRSQFEATLIKKNDKPVNLKNKEIIDEILGELKKSTYTIAQVQKQEVMRHAPPPFMTSTLQRQASSIFGFSAKRTMQAAQSLYENGHITYMRTDSLNLSENFISSSRSFIEKQFGRNYVPEKPKYYKSHAKVAQEAHEAIRPTNPSAIPEGDLKQTLNHDEQIIYGLIWKRGIASQMNPALFEQQTVDVVSASDQTTAKYLFRAVGRRLTFDGFLTLYPHKEKEEEEKEEELEELPNLVAKEPVSVKDYLPQQKFTEPPARFTEGSLIKALEEYGIGRPSTYAPIISTIQDRYYVEKEDNKFHPTPVGETVNAFLVEHFSNLLDYDFTARMEESLDEIARGAEDWVKVIRDFYTPFIATLNEVVMHSERVMIEFEETHEVCEKCGKPMIIRIGRFGKFLACSGFPDCRNTKPIIKKINLICPKCGGDIVQKRTRKGKMFYGCSNYPKCDFASWRKPNQKPLDQTGEEKPAQL